MRISNKIVAGVMVFQFLNVQIQSAFGTEATRSMNEEYQQLRQKLDDHLAHKMESWSEDRQIRFAEKLTHIAIRARNKVSGMSESNFNRRYQKQRSHFLPKSNIEAVTADQEQLNDQDTSELSSDVSTFDDLKTISQGLAPTNIETATEVMQTSVSQAQFIEQIDTVLVGVGASKNSGGLLESPDHETFQNQFLSVGSKDSAKQFRSVASLGLVRLVVALLLAMAAVLLLIFVFTLIEMIFVSMLRWIIFLGTAACVGYGYFYISFGFRIRL